MHLLTLLAAVLLADPRQAVLATEARWVSAIDARDAAALAHILAPDFIHTNYRGIVRRRADELRLVKQPKPYRQRTSDQDVDVLGSVAVVHGTNDIFQAGRIVLRLRYTDVYRLENGSWRAVSAQETAIQ